VENVIEGFEECIKVVRMSLYWRAMKRGGELGKCRLGR
jgi:hypothetical protein